MTRRLRRKLKRQFLPRRREPGAIYWRRFFPGHLLPHSSLRDIG